MFAKFFFSPFFCLQNYLKFSWKNVGLAGNTLTSGNYPASRIKDQGSDCRLWKRFRLQEKVPSAPTLGPVKQKPQSIMEDITRCERIPQIPANFKMRKICDLNLFSRDWLNLESEIWKDQGGLAEEWTTEIASRRIPKNIGLSLRAWPPLE